MRQPDLPLRSGVVLLGTVEVGHSHDRAMSAQHLLDHPMAPAWVDHLAADLGVLQHPCPLVAAVDAGTRLLTANQTATAQTGEHLRHPLGEARLDRLEQIGQGPCTAGELEHLPKEPSQSRVADGMRIPQRGRQTLDGGPTGHAGFHSYGYRGPRDLPAVGTRPPLLRHTGDHGLDRGDRDLVLDGLPLLIGLLDPVPTMRTTFRLGDDDGVWVWVQWPATTSTSPTRLATRPCAWAWRDVRLVGT